MKSLEIQEIKLVLVGAVSVGKTSIVLRFVNMNFNECSESTVGASFLTKTLNVKGRSVRFQIWDTAGAERYHSLTPMYYRSAQIALIVFDITRSKTLEDASKWAYELKTNGGEECLLYLVGNKSDLESEVSDEQCKSLASELDAIYKKVSAKTGEGVQELFETIAERVVELDSTYTKQDSSTSGEEAIDIINVNPKGESGKKKCC